MQVAGGENIGGEMFADSPFDCVNGEVGADRAYHQILIVRFSGGQIAEPILILTGAL